jgi:glycosyl-4,4'-diaponeurosporenoate acyltransferase
VRPVPAVLVDAAVWAGWGTAVGWVASRVPAGRLRPSRTRPWERRAYERLGVRRWKDRLPEAGAIFGGPSKRRLPGRDLVAFARESRRAELVHRVVPLAVLAFPLWNPWWLTAVMVAYALVANVPCVVVARYNAARIARMVSC